MLVAAAGTPACHRFNNVGLALVAAGGPEHVEVRQQPRHVTALAEKMDLVVDADLLAVAPQAVALRAVADHQQMHVVADHLQQVGRPDGVFTRFCGHRRPTSPTSRLPSGGANSASSWPRVVRRLRGEKRHAVGDHPRPPAGVPWRDVESRTPSLLTTTARQRPAKVRSSASCSRLFHGSTHRCPTMKIFTPQARAAANP